MDNPDLGAIRARIDQLDAEIVRLLDARAEAGREAGRAKAALSLPLSNPGREQAILARLPSLSNGSMPPDALRSIYRVIMAETLAQEKPGDACAGDCGGAAPGKVDAPAVVLENAPIAPGFRRMRLKAPALAGLFQPGQFFQLRIELAGLDPFLRRPFAPSEFEDGVLSFVYAVVGTGTERMAALPPGHKAGILAPLGNAFTPSPEGVSAILVGGGCGAPSLVPLARRFHETGVKTTVVVGARKSDFLLEHHLFDAFAEQLILTTDDGSHGQRGTVVDALKTLCGGRDKERCRIYACGPLRMLAAVAAFARERELECEVSLEERMACGFGACMGCVVPVIGADGKSVYRRVCHDGPVFNARDLAWDEMR